VFEWTSVERPGPLGASRTQRFAQWNEEYGCGNWRLAWLLGDESNPDAAMEFIHVCELYERAYFRFLEDNKDVLTELVAEAQNIYTNDPRDVDAKLDFATQNGGRKHITDIAIRRAVTRLVGENPFSGKRLIQIGEERFSDHPLGNMLSPGCIWLHHTNWIAKPELRGWWHHGTIASFLYSNQWLQRRRQGGLIN
jgi:hypothetical protein